MIDADPEQIALFVECYHRNGGDAVAACVEARVLDPMYSVTTIAARLMDRPEVQVAIATMKKMKATAATAEVTRESIVQDMQAVYEKHLHSDGKVAIAAKRLQAEILRLLGHDITINVKHDVTMMSDAQLAAIVAGKAIDGQFTDVTDVSPKPKQGIAQLAST